MKFDSLTGLYKGNGLSVRVELTGKVWGVYKVEPGLEKNWREWSLKKPLFTTSLATCLNKQQVIEAWLKTSPFRKDE